MMINHDKHYKNYCMMATLKVGIASLICLLVIARFHIESGFMMLLPIFIIPLAYPSEVYPRCRDRFVGSVIGSIISVLILALVQNWAIYFLLTLGFITASLTIMYSAQYIYAALMMSLVSGVIFMLAHGDMHQALDFAIAWPRNVAIGVFILFVADYIIWPKHITYWLGQYLRTHKISDINFAKCNFMFKNTKPYTPLSHMCKMKKEIDLLEHIKFHDERIQTHIQTIQKEDPSLYAKLEPHHQELSRILSSITHHLDEAIAPDSTLIKSFESECEYLHALFRELRKKTGVLTQSWHASAAFVGIGQHYSSIHHYLTEFKNTPTPSTLDAAEPIKITKEHFIQAAKVGLTVMLSLAVCIAFQIPGGVQVVIAAFIAAMQPDLGKISEKIIHRLLGLVIGAGASIFMAIIIAHLPYAYTTGILYLVAIMIFTYVGLLKPAWFYIMVQAGVAVSLLLAFNTVEIAPNLNVLGERILGVAIGYCVAISIMTLIGGKDPTKLLPVEAENYVLQMAKVLGLTVHDKEHQIKKEMKTLKNQYAKLKTLTDRIKTQLGIGREVHNSFNTLVNALQKLQFNLDAIAELEKVHHVIKQKSIQTHLNDRLNLTHDLLTKWAIAAQKKPIDRKSTKIKLEKAISEGDAYVEKCRTSSTLKKLTTEELATFYSLETCFRNMLVALDEAIMEI